MIAGGDFISNLIAGPDDPTPIGQTNPHAQEYANDLYSRLTSLLGNKTNAISGPQGVAQSTAGYDFGPTDQAIAGFSQGTPATSPYQYNFKGLPETYGTQAYEQEAPDIQRAGTAQLQQIKESVGTRRPGLLLKAGQQSQRDVGEQLAKIRSGIGLQEQQQNVALGQQQQQAQAAENARAATETANNKFRNLQALGEAGSGKVGQQAQLTGLAQNYQMAPLQYLQGLYSTATGGNNQAASTGAGYGSSTYGSTLGFLGNVAGGAIPKPKID